MIFLDYTIEKTHHDGATALYEIRCGEAHAQGIVSKLPGSVQSMLAIQCTNGMLLCRLFDVEVASKLNVPAAVFSAADLDAMLAKTPLSLTESARAAGCTTEMTGLELLVKLSK